MESLHPTLTIVWAMIGLLFITAITFAICKRYKLPLSVMLVVVGIAIAYIAQYGPPYLAPLAAYKISPDIILYVCLPTLIYESAYNLEFRQLRENLTPVLTLAVPGLLISTIIIGVFVWLGTTIALGAALLLGAILSATDPVAVISLFRQLGAPKRLTILVEGESLFNDATAIVTAKILFTVVVAGAFSWHFAYEGVLEFFIEFVGGALVGWGLAVIVGYLLGLVESEPFIEISLTTLLAYFSFVIAHEFFHVSGVMATVAAGLTMGDWGRTKISPSVAEYMHNFWEYLAFIANALIFLLVGLSVHLGVLRDTLWPLFIVVVAMLVSRAVVIYGLVPLLGRLSGAEPIEMPYRTVMYWGGVARCHRFGHHIEYWGLPIFRGVYGHCDWGGAFYPIGSRLNYRSSRPLPSA